VAKENTSGELLIESILKKHKILFDRKKRLTTLKKDPKKFRIPDFYLPAYGLCIEYFGSWDLEQESLRSKERARFLEKIAVYELNKVKCVYLYPHTLKYAEKIILTAIEKVKIGWELDKGALDKLGKKVIIKISKPKIVFVPKEGYSMPHWLNFLLFFFAGALLALFFVLFAFNSMLFFQNYFQFSMSTLDTIGWVIRTVNIGFFIATVASICTAIYFAHRKYLLNEFMWVFYLVMAALVVLSLINIVFNPIFLNGMFLAFFTVMILVPVETYMAWNIK